MEYSTKQLQIIEVAEKLFAKNGFAGTSVRDIAQEADVNVSMISYYFGSKEKLIEALFHFRMTESRSQLESLLTNEDLSPIQKINMLIDNVIDRLMNNQRFHKIMLRETLSSGRTPIISEHIMNLKVRNMELMQKLIGEGQQSGVFREDIDMSLMSTTLYGTINYAIATQDFYKKINQLESMEPEEFKLHLKKKLSQHLRSIFKSTVTNEHHTEN